MTQTETLSTPSTSLDPASFFTAPPQSATDLQEARNQFFSDSALADKFEDMAREARQAKNTAVAASASWVCGQYAHAMEFVQGDGEMENFIRISSLHELGKHEQASELASTHWKSKDSALAGASLFALNAARDYESVLKNSPKASLSPADTAFFSARCLELSGDYESACEGYEKILSEDPSNFPARFSLAYRLDLYGNEKEAARHYEALLERRPISTAVLLNLGLIYEERNDFEKSCGCYSAILRRDPNHPSARLFFRDSHESLDMFYDEDLERKEDHLMQVLRTPISDFELSVRARNCLINMDIHSLEDLVSHSEPELLEFKNFGETSLNEIKHVLHAKGLRLGMRREDGSFVIPEDFGANGYFDAEKELHWLGELTDDQRESLEMQISTLNLSVRCHRALVERLNLQRIGDILRYSEEDLLGMPNFGITSLNELSSKLTELNLRIRSGRGEEYGQSME
ncbi:MAG: DNA-directed RNA polymerase subunit alpha C-terminal domain-containing protein [Planctomycetota bacterium]|jgi:DNA-directed RNA polymerase subunit alpha|nr:DNA-directed RNA polymerase subunit alpha C-terminal domain-containing protein [Planctomycetota bacterium]MDP6940577.1 DNA-directed RNA polymerase subunit alpha C-terminal domain-containing protein [Planctomycetota bacterium]